MGTWQGTSPTERLREDPVAAMGQENGALQERGLQGEGMRGPLLG